MQRKNGVLKRRGMAMMMAIIMVVAISTILALSLSLSTQTGKKTADLYLYEQSVVLSYAATEYAVLALSRQATPCSLPNINFVYNNIYTINVDMQYIPFNGASACRQAAANNGTILAMTTDANSDGTVIMDVSVTANPAGATEPIRYFRRTIQKL